MPSITMLSMVLMVAAQAFSWSGRNDSLRDIPDRGWKPLCNYNGSYTGDGGIAEVPWAYDPGNRNFVRVGGCTNIYTNEICVFDAGTQTTTFAWPQAAPPPADRPGPGCNRGVCYDPVSRCVWNLMGGDRSSFVYGLWKGDMTAKTWTQMTTAENGTQAHVAADTAERKLVLNYWDIGHWMHTKVWVLDSNVMRECRSMPGSPDLVTGYPADWWYAMEYVPVMHGVMMAGYMLNADSARGIQAGWFCWLFDTRTETWTDLHSTGLTGPAGRAVLSYDPVAQVVLVMRGGSPLTVYMPSENAWQTAAAMPAGSWTEMFEYDSEHNVHLCIEYDPSTNGRVWAFRYMNEGGTTLPPVTRASIPGPALDCFPNPFRAGTRIAFSMDQASRVSLSIYDIQGRMLDLLVDGTVPQGRHAVSWNAGNVAPGLYIIRLENDHRTLRYRAVLAK